ncbi:MAG TPA: response regulator transcription factor [Actinomycetota bacterium]|nr:response regulator transcription factor [Actinomycetota bacterium]
MTTIAIIEDHKVVADALDTMLGFQEGFEVVGKATSGSDAIHLVDREHPDVVLMDVTLEGLNGIEATREIMRKHPTSKVLVLSMHDDQETVTRAISAGAAGFLPKNVDREELIAAINAVAAGKGFLHPEVTRPFLTRFGGMADKQVDKERLTDRERMVLEELSQGKSTKLIAESLVVAEETVKTHLTHIYQKLGVSDRVQAVALALRRGLVR